MPSALLVAFVTPVISVVTEYTVAPCACQALFTCPFSGLLRHSPGATFLEAVPEMAWTSFRGQCFGKTKIALPGFWLYFPVSSAAWALVPCQRPFPTTTISPPPSAPSSINWTNPPPRVATTTASLATVSSSTSRGISLRRPTSWRLFATVASPTSSSAAPIAPLSFSQPPSSPWTPNTTSPSFAPTPTPLLPNTKSAFYPSLPSLLHPANPSSPSLSTRLGSKAPTPSKSRAKTASLAKSFLMKPPRLKSQLPPPKFSSSAIR